MVFHICTPCACNHPLLYEMLLWYHGRMFNFLNNATTCNVLKPANLCTGSGYKLVDLKIPSGYVCFEPTLARMEEQRIGQNQDLKPGIARSSNCRFESGRSEIVIRYFRLMLKEIPVYISSFSNSPKHKLYLFHLF